MNDAWIFTGVLLVLYVYNDYNYRKRLEKKDEFIKDLEIKFMSRDVTEYAHITEDAPETIEPEPDPYVDIDDLENIKSIEQIEEISYRS